MTVSSRYQGGTCLTSMPAMWTAFLWVLPASIRARRAPREITHAGGPVTRVEDGDDGGDGKEAAMGAWREPDAGARYLCDDGNVRTWGDLTRNLEEDVYPRDAEDER